MSDPKTLPACPLCGEVLRVFEERGFTPVEAWCPTWKENGARADCALAGVSLPFDAWRRLAAPLAPEAEAVLRAVETLELYDAARGYETDSFCAEALMKARGAWINAGRPGLPPEGKEGGG